MYPFERAPLWRVSKVAITASAAALAADEPLTSPTKVSVTLTDLRANDVNALTTNLTAELARKPRRAEAISAAQLERLPSPDSETEIEMENNNHTRTASLRN